ncbi:hypothetical protein LTS12_029031 [Elasticomyces elasticus]|nr:hypothetical protein LTS12_029031 [Elasticomyces elasticus]
MAYTQQDFYGGAIVGAIPAGWLDSSTLREVPDHQEIYLSPTTLSNFIFELNQAVSNEDALASVSGDTNNGTETETEAIDKAAATYHLHDLCDEGDTVQTIVAPQRVTLAKFAPETLVRAYGGVVSFTTPKKQRSRQDEGANGGTTNGGPEEASRLTCHYLMVRMERQETDVLVFLNVPHDEFDAREDTAGLEGEEGLARGLIQRIIQTLEVKDWGLFV